MIHKDSEALCGFFDTNRYCDEPNTSVTGHRTRRTSVAMIVIGVYAKVAFAAHHTSSNEASSPSLRCGQLKDRYNHTGRLRLETAGDPYYPDDKKQAEHMARQD